VPAHFSQVPRLLRETTGHDLVLASAGPPDRHGYFSLGTNADYVASFIGEVPFFLEVNERMPRTSGQNRLHVSQLAGWCQADYPLDETVPRLPDDRDEKIAAFVAERVPDGACVQVGVGRIPNVLLAALRGHRELGVHTEAMSDGIMDLIERGALTGVRKHQRRGKHVATFYVGTRRCPGRRSTVVSRQPPRW
jgi:acyl-CoA hydrolase